MCLHETMKVIFYDFDNTLCLWKLSPAAKRTYEDQVKKILQVQRDQGIHVAIVSYSTQVRLHCEQIGIDLMVDDIRNAPDKTKAEMIHEILEEIKVSKENALFLDDDADAVEEVRLYGVRSICVSSMQGIVPFFRKHLEQS